MQVVFPRQRLSGFSASTSVLMLRSERTACNGPVCQRTHFGNQRWVMSGPANRDLSKKSEREQARAEACSSALCICRLRATAVSGFVPFLSLVQGAYYLATGVWPLISIRTFEA